MSVWRTRDNGHVANAVAQVENGAERIGPAKVVLPCVVGREETVDVGNAEGFNELRKGPSKGHEGHVLQRGQVRERLWVVVLLDGQCAATLSILPEGAGEEAGTAARGDGHGAI